MSEKFLEGFLELAQFAAEVKRTQRQVRRWLDEPDGLPFTRMGGRVYIHIPTARDWLFSRMRGRNPTRKQRDQAAV